MTIKIGALFAGYGGLELGIEHALPGGEVAWHAEIDPAPSRILAHHWPDVPNLGDVTAVDWTAVPRVDVLTGGFPCQDVWHAGLRKGLKPGTRSGLWAHFALAIDTLRPSLVVIENVRGLLSAEAHSELEPGPWDLGGPDGSDRPPLRALGAVLGDLADLRYDARWVGVRAADAGAPHGRLRIFILARPAGDAADAAHRGRARSESEHGREPDTHGSSDRIPAGGRPPARLGADAPHSVSGFPADALWTALGGEPLTARHSPDVIGERALSGSERLGGVEARGADRAAAADAGGSTSGWGAGVAIGGEIWGAAPRRDRRAAPDARPELGDAGRGGEPGATPGAGALRHDRGRDRLPTPAGLRGADPAIACSAAPDAGRDESERWGGSGSVDGTPPEAPSARDPQHDAARASRRTPSDWGPYGAAVARWERAIGRLAPEPTEVSPKGAHRLNPAFVEWMMGLPAGHVTDPRIGLTRNEQLKALGNGVVPQQAALALKLLLNAELAG